MAQMRPDGHTGGAGPQPQVKRNVVPFGKYLLLERISVGGMAEVYKAKAFGVEGFEKILAIKRILPTIAEDEEFIDMFIDEAKIVGQLSHANICQVLELGRIGDSHFIAMEYIWGRDLLQIQNHFRRQKLKMPVPMAVFIISKVCEGLDYAHRKRDAQGRPLGIVHRDVSPQNVLVAYEGAVKIIDFGIARAAYRQTRTQAGVLKGKFGYMSPEQVRGLPIDRRSDLFAVGTLLYELLTAERLFLGESDFSTLDKVRNAEVDPPSRHNSEIPPELERIVMKALAREPDDRWQWASEMQEALQRVLINFKPVFTTQKLAGWMKENFSAQITRDKAKMEEFARIGQDALVAARKQKAPPPPPPPGAGSAPPGPPGVAVPPMPARPQPGALPSSPPIPSPGTSNLTKDLTAPARRPNDGQVSLNDAEMDWLMRGADDDDDDDYGESTVIADMDLGSFDDIPGTPGSPPGGSGSSRPGPAPGAPGGIPAPAAAPSGFGFATDALEGEEEEEEATAIYFVNEEALAALDQPDIDDIAPKTDIPEQPTQLLDTGQGDINEQSTMIFDEQAVQAELDKAQGVAVAPAVNIGPPLAPPPASGPPPAGPGQALASGAPPHASPRPGPTGPPPQPSGPPMPGAPGAPGPLPKTMMLEPGQNPPLPPLGGVAPPGPGTAPPPGQAMSLPGQAAPPSPASPDSRPPMAEPLSTEVLPGKAKAGEGEKKKRSPLLFLLIAAVAVIVLGGGVGLALFVFLPGSGEAAGGDATENANVASAANLSGGDSAPDASAAPAASQDAVTANAGGGNTRTPDAATPPPPPAESGRVFLTVQPEEAVVQIDGAAVSREAFTAGVPISAGQEHTIRASAPGHRPQEVTLTVTAGQEERRTITLDPLTELAISSTPPGADVSVDGRNVGTTPTKVADLELGQHKIRFWLDNHRPVSKTVELSRETPRASVDVTLVAKSSPGAGSRPGSGPSRPVKRPPTKEPASGGGQGSLVVSTQPWGHVYIDGRDTGRNTPILPSNPLRLSPGRHRLTIQTNNGQRFTFPITIVAGETRRFMRRLDVQ